MSNKFFRLELRLSCLKESKDSQRLLSLSALALERISNHDVFSTPGFEDVSKNRNFSNGLKECNIFDLRCFLIIELERSIIENKYSSEPSKGLVIVESFKVRGQSRTLYKLKIVK